MLVPKVSVLERVDLDGGWNWSPLLVLKSLLGVKYKPSYVLTGLIKELNSYFSTRIPVPSVPESYPGISLPSASVSTATA